MVDQFQSLPNALPERTLGWGVLEWADAYVRQPDGPDAGGQWEFTTEQARFVLWWYAVDETGRFIYSRGVLRRAKGWGKSPFVAALALAELCGPVRFDGWDAAGNPVGVPVALPWVQLAGVSEKQTTNTMSVVLAMVEESPIVEDYGLDVGLTRIFTRKRGRLEPITASAPTAEGARPTFIVEDETHHWLDSNGGHKLDAVNRRNVGKIRGGAARVLETTNAHEPGVGSVAERSYENWLAQRESRSRIKPLLYDTLEPAGLVDLADEDQLKAALKVAYGDSDWVDLDRIRDEVYDLATPPDQSRRFYLNQVVAAADAWLDPGEWDACAVPEQVDDGELVVIAFDGSKNDDASALVGCRVSDGLLWVIGCWEKPEGPSGDGWEVPREQVDGLLGQVFERLDVAGFYSDLHPWESYVDRWAELYGEGLTLKASPRHAVAWDMRARLREFTVAAERFEAAVRDGQLCHDGGMLLRRHALNARRRPNKFGIGVGKESRESPRKVDAVVAAVLARLARQDYLALPDARKRRNRTGRLAGYF